MKQSKTIIFMLNKMALRAYYIIQSKYRYRLSVLFLIGFLFSLDGFSQQWMQLGNDLEGENAMDVSGASVSLSADGYTLAIGSPGTIQGGQVRIYSWNGTSWIQKGSDLHAESALDGFGYSVSLSNDGNTMAIGGVDNSGNGMEAGHVRVFTWNGASWMQKGTDLDGEAAGDRSGLAVSLSSDGNTIAIGAFQNDGNGSNSGHVRIYSWSGSSWVQKGSDIDGESAEDRSGASVSLSSDGNTIAIGAPANDGSNWSSGHVRVYNWDGASWIQKGMDINGEGEDDHAGQSVSLSSDGNTVAVGARDNDDGGLNAGHARVYTWDGASWIQKGMDIDGEAEGDHAGHTLCLSSDGNILALGAPDSDKSDTSAGQVRVFAWNGSSWIHVGSAITGDAAWDYFGSTVSLSANGQVLASGAPYNGNGGQSAGHAKVFTNTSIGIQRSTLPSQPYISTNPISGNATINLQQTYPSIMLSTWNTAGQLLEKRTFENVSVLHTRLQHPSGIYLLQLCTPSGETATLKLAK